MSGGERTLGRLLDWVIARLPEPTVVTCLDCRDGQHAACDGGCACTSVRHPSPPQSAWTSSDGVTADAEATRPDRPTAEPGAGSKPVAPVA